MAGIRATVWVDLAEAFVFVALCVPRALGCVKNASLEVACAWGTAHGGMSRVEIAWGFVYAAAQESITRDGSVRLVSTPEC